MGVMSRRRGRRLHRQGKFAVEAHGDGHATHNGSTKPGQLEVTIWGTVDKEPDREVALVLSEEGVQALLASLRRFGLLL